eukprot:1584106-Rhodomonas_salina.1
MSARDRSDRCSRSVEPVMSGGLGCPPCRRPTTCPPPASVSEGGREGGRERQEELRKLRERQARGTVPQGDLSPLCPPTVGGQRGESGWVWERLREQ